MKHRTHSLLLLSSVLSLASGSTIAAATPAVLSASSGATLQSCEGLLANFHYAQTRVDAAAVVAEGALQQGTQAMPAHCLVKGSMHQRKGMDGRDYAIAFEMRLPQAWNCLLYTSPSPRD